MKLAKVCVLILVLPFSANAEDVNYRTHIQPLWKEKCSVCHGPNSPYHAEFEKNKEKFKAQSKGPRMDTYADLIMYIGWPDTGALMRRLDDGSNTKDKKPGNMYQYLGENDAERQKNLATFKAWVGKDAWSLKRLPDVTGNDLKKIRAEY